MSRFTDDNAGGSTQFVPIGAECVAFIPYLFTIPLCLYANMSLICQATTGKMERFTNKTSRGFTLFGLNIALLYGICGLLLVHIAMYYVDNTTLNHIFSSVSILLFMSAWWLILLFLNIKNWLIFWNSKFSYYSYQLQWQQLINTNIVKQKMKTNWFIKNNHKYSKLKFVTQIFGIYSFCGWFCFLLYLIVPSLEFIIVPIGFLLLILFIIFYAIIICKTPYQSDTFFIHKESRIHAKLLLIIALGMMIMVLSFTFNVNNKSNNIVPFISTGVFFNMMNIVFCAMNLISVRIVNQRRKQQAIIKHNSTKDNNNIYNMQLILSNHKAINLFMMHLSKEYSMECLLAYIEINQYQQYIVDNHRNEIDQEIFDNIELIQFPHNIPLSEIIEHHHEEERKNNNRDGDDDELFVYKVKAHKIYLKYVQHSAEFEINISSSMRTNVANIMGDLDIFLKCNVSYNDLLKIFEDCKQSMYKLLVYSLTRFKSLQEFDEVKQIFDKDMKEQVVFESRDRLDTIASTYSNSPPTFPKSIV